MCCFKDQMAQQMQGERASHLAETLGFAMHLVRLLEPPTTAVLVRT